ncbi:hypothetical protein QR680_004070 [Steinernema hermaphroditum]|uniref:Uncharacterized protein n=1 Tax=Steinernema hermaphroditum TaxID=289476 RepID=A0AA39HMJ7_9BILA|nr:hypothetical protein QR680_004070 [Steinernema hermaphroditum]
MCFSYESQRIMECDLKHPCYPTKCFRPRSTADSNLFIENLFKKRRQLTGVFVDLTNPDDVSIKDVLLRHSTWKSHRNEDIDAHRYCDYNTHADNCTLKTSTRKSTIGAWGCIKAILTDQHVRGPCTEIVSGEDVCVVLMQHSPNIIINFRAGQYRINSSRKAMNKYLENAELVDFENLPHYADFALWGDYVYAVFSDYSIEDRSNRSPIVLRVSLRSFYVERVALASNVKYATKCRITVEDWFVFISGVGSSGHSFINRMTFNLNKSSKTIIETGPDPIVMPKSGIYVIQDSVESDDQSDNDEVESNASREFRESEESNHSSELAESQASESSDDLENLSTALAIGSSEMLPRPPEGAHDEVSHENDDHVSVSYSWVSSVSSVPTSDEEDQSESEEAQELRLSGAELEAQENVRSADNDGAKCELNDDEIANKQMTQRAVGHSGSVPEATETDEIEDEQFSQRVSPEVHNSGFGRELFENDEIVDENINQHVSPGGVLQNHGDDCEPMQYESMAQEQLDYQFEETTTFVWKGEPQSPSAEQLQENLRSSPPKRHLEDEEVNTGTNQCIVKKYRPVDKPLMFSQQAHAAAGYDDYDQNLSASPSFTPSLVHVKVDNDENEAPGSVSRVDFYVNEAGMFQCSICSGQKIKVYSCRKCCLSAICAECIIDGHQHDAVLFDRCYTVDDARKRMSAILEKLYAETFAFENTATDLISKMSYGQRDEIERIGMEVWSNILNNEFVTEAKFKEALIKTSALRYLLNWDTKTVIAEIRKQLA